MYDEVDKYLSEQSDGAYPHLPLLMSTAGGAQADPVLRRERAEETMGIIFEDGIDCLVDVCEELGVKEMWDWGSGPGNVGPVLSHKAGIPSTGVEINEGYFNYQPGLFKWLREKWPANLARISTLGDMFDCRMKIYS